MKNIQYVGLLGFLVLALLSCSPKEKDSSKIVANTDEMHSHMNHVDQIQVELDADLPIFQPSERTYTNYVDFKTSENVYVRQNTSMNNKSKVIAFYKENLLKNGWILNVDRSNDEKMVVRKDDRYATIRLFELKQADTISLAFSINLVRPKLVLPDTKLKDTESDMHDMMHQNEHDEHSMMGMK